MRINFTFPSPPFRYFTYEHIMTALNSEQKLLCKINVAFIPLMMLIQFFQVHQQEYTSSSSNIVQFSDRGTLANAVAMGIFQDTHMTQSEFSWASALVFIGNLAFQVSVGKRGKKTTPTTPSDTSLATQCLFYAQAAYCKVPWVYCDHMGRSGILHSTRQQLSTTCSIKIPIGYGRREWQSCTFFDYQHIVSPIRAACDQCRHDFLKFYCSRSWWRD